MVKSLILALFLCFLTASFYPAYALQVKKVSASGKMLLDDGQSIYFAGIVLNEEAFRFIPSIVAGKEVTLEFEDFKPEGKVAALRDRAYVFIEKREIPFPFPPDAEPKIQKVMINEFLIALGVAKFDTSKPCRYQDRLLKVEEATQAKGESLFGAKTPTRL